jgi:hypothetical protein
MNSFGRFASSIATVDNIPVVVGGESMTFKARISSVMLLIAAVGIGLAGLVEWRRQRSASRLKVVVGSNVVFDYIPVHKAIQGKPEVPKSSP